MSLVIDTLRTSPVTEELSDAEVEILADLFEIKEYKAEDVIVQPDDEQPDNLYILAYGDIEVKIECGAENTTIHVLKPGDLAGMITFAGGAATQVSATLYAVGATKVLSMPRLRFESLLNSHPKLVYRVMRGIIRNMHGIVRRVNSESAELSNYIYKTGGRY
ncbi:MAG: cyclic nucleotide-binding domain-containing protein [Gallionella sp.]